MGKPRAMLQWEKLTPVGFDDAVEGKPIPLYSEYDAQRLKGREFIRLTVRAKAHELQEGPFAGEDEKWND